MRRLLRATQVICETSRAGLSRPRSPAGFAARRRTTTVESVRALLTALRTRRRLLAGLQLAFLAVFLAFLGYAFRDAWADAAPRLRRADPLDLGIAGAVLA